MARNTRMRASTSWRTQCGGSGMRKTKIGVLSRVGRSKEGHDVSCPYKCGEKAGQNAGGWKSCGWERTTMGVVECEGLYKRSWKWSERRGRTARTDRRKPGVERRNAESGIKNSSKILLTENGAHTILPLRQSLPSRKNVPAFLLYPHAGKTVNKECRCQHN